MIARELTGQEQELVENALILARSKRPYYAMAMAALKPYAVDGLKTVGVDKYWRLYVDPVWFEAQERDHRANMLAGHEIEHLLRRHPARHEATAAEPSAWNIAADCEINDDCGLTWPETHRQMPAKIGAEDGLTAEEYLRYVQDMADAMDCGSGAGGAQREWELGDDGQGMTKDAEQAVIESTAAAVMEHIKQHGRGSVPAGIAMWAEDKAKGKLPPSWDRHFQNLIGRLSREMRAARADYSYARMHRRTRPESVIRPASVAPVITVGIVVDTSGSMCEYGAKVLATVRGVVRKYTSVVIDCDAGVSQVKRGWGKITHRGGGGTDLRPAIELAQTKADAVVIVTDCDTPWPEAVTKPVVVVATGDGKVPAWAKVVRVTGA